MSSVKPAKLRPPRDPVRTILKVLIGVLIVGLVGGALFIVGLYTPNAKVISQLSSGQDSDSKE